MTSPSRARVCPTSTVVTYRRQDADPIVLEIPEGQDWAEVCNAVQAKLFPNVTDEERRADRAKIDAILARDRKPGSAPQVPETARSGAAGVVVRSPASAGPFGASETSIKAYATLKAGGHLTRQQSVVKAAMVAGRDYTRQELVRASGLAINVIAGRCRELIDLGEIEVGRKRECSVTHYEVEALRLVERMAVAA